MRYQQPLVYVDAVARAGSIRKAAETLAISSTALNRRILSIEEEINAPLFERLAGGVRLSAAGEIFMHFARRELAEAERMRERVAELSGERRGHIAFACGQSLMPLQLSELIAQFRRDHPRVTMAIDVVAHPDIPARLEEIEADLALALSPEPRANVKIIASAEQAVQLICRHDHPLLDTDGPVRLDDCYDYPMALPPVGQGVRHLLEARATELGRELPLVLQSGSVALLMRQIARDWTITFGINTGGAVHSISDNTLTSRDLDTRDVQPATLSLLQLRGRTLPVAAARFAEQLGSLLATGTLPDS